MGMANTGKSSLCMKFVHKSFSPEYDPTQLEIYTKEFFDGKGELGKFPFLSCKLQVILDTAGDQLNLDNIQEWVNHGDGFILVYSIDNKASFQYIEQLITKIQLIKENKQIPIVLVGNRCDLEEERKVSKEEGKKFA